MYTVFILVQSHEEKSEKSIAKNVLVMESGIKRRFLL